MSKTDSVCRLQYTEVSSDSEDEAFLQYATASANGEVAAEAALRAQRGLRRGHDPDRGVFKGSTLADSASGPMNGVPTGTACLMPPAMAAPLHGSPCIQMAADVAGTGPRSSESSCSSVTDPFQDEASPCSDISLPPDKTRLPGSRTQHVDPRHPNCKQSGSCFSGDVGGTNGGSNNSECCGRVESSSSSADEVEELSYRDAWTASSAAGSGKTGSGAPTNGKPSLSGRAADLKAAGTASLAAGAPISTPIAPNTVCAVHAGLLRFLWPLVLQCRPGWKPACKACPENSGQAHCCSAARPFVCYRPPLPRQLPSGRAPLPLLLLHKAYRPSTSGWQHGSPKLLHERRETMPSRVGRRRCGGRGTALRRSHPGPASGGRRQRPSPHRHAAQQPGRGATAC